MQKINYSKVQSPLALATFGAFFVPEPLGGCLLLAAAIWWSYRRLLGSDFLSDAGAVVQRLKIESATALPTDLGSGS